MCRTDYCPLPLHNVRVHVHTSAHCTGRHDWLKNTDETSATTFLILLELEVTLGMFFMKKGTKIRTIASCIQTVVVCEGECIMCREQWSVCSAHLSVSNMHTEHWTFRNFELNTISIVRDFTDLKTVEIVKILQMIHLNASCRQRVQANPSVEFSTFFFDGFLQHILPFIFANSDCH